MTITGMCAAGNSFRLHLILFVKAECSLVSKLSVRYRCTCPSSLTLANKHLLHDISNPICYPPNASSQPHCSPAAETVTNAQSWEIQARRPSPNSSLFVLIGEQTPAFDSIAGNWYSRPKGKAHYCSVERISSTVKVRASCITSSHQTSALNYRGTTMDLQAVLRYFKSIVFQCCSCDLNSGFTG